MLFKKTILLLILLLSITLYSQEKGAVKQNDSLIENSSLPLNNGIIYHNKYKNTLKNTTQFFENKYRKGTICYNNQTYFDVNLKYNVFEDLVFYKPNAKIGLEANLITKQVDYFIYANKKFKQLNYIDIVEKNGFFEEIEINNNITLYIKYKKVCKEDLSLGNIAYTFYDSKLYYILYNNQLLEISSKSSIISIFPNLKKEINTFYKENSKIKDSNIQQFYQNLLKTIN
mgnify:FL=1